LRRFTLEGAEVRASTLTWKRAAPLDMSR